MGRTAVVLLLMTGALVAVACAAAPSGTPAAPSTATPGSAIRTPSASRPSVAPSTPSALPAFAPDEPLVLYALLTGAGGGIFVMRPDGSGRTRLASDVLPGVHKRGDWSPDGQDVVFVNEGDGRIYVAHLDGSPTTVLPTCESGGCDYPRWSPDGTRIAYSRVENGDGVVGPASVGIETIELTSGDVTPVVRLGRPVLADVPTWSPDGTRIAFQVDRMDDAANETGAALAVVPVAGGTPRYLTDFDVFASSPDWGWVRDELAFSTELVELKEEHTPGDETWDLWSVHADGSGLRRITRLAKGGELKVPIWTPDGTAITAYDAVGGRGVIVDPTTGMVRPFLTTGAEYRPSVRPIPSR